MPMGRILPVHASCIRRLATTTLLFAALRWSEPEAEGLFFVGSPFNKLASGPDLRVGALLLPLSSCRHGEGRRDVEGVGGRRVSSPSGATAAAFSDEQVLRFMACGWWLAVALVSFDSVEWRRPGAEPAYSHWVQLNPTTFDCHVYTYRLSSLPFRRSLHPSADRRRSASRLGQATTVQIQDVFRRTINDT